MNSKYTGLQVEALLDKVQGQYTKEEINALIGNYEKKAWMGTSAQYNALEQIDEDRMYLITDGTAPDGSNIVDLTQYYTKDEINELLTGKANTAHTHTLGDITDYTAPTYKTINGESILGEGNITIEGGSGGASYDDTEVRELINGKANIEHKHKITDLIGVIQTIESGLYFIDSNLNIGVKIDEKGIHAKNIIEYDIVKTD